MFQKAITYALPTAYAERVYTATEPIETTRA